MDVVGAGIGQRMAEVPTGSGEAQHILALLCGHKFILRPNQVRVFCMSNPAWDGWIGG
jgi:hypothetical protein